MKTEIITKNIIKPKLTITPNRLTIKFPETFEDKDRIIKFSDKIKNILHGKITQSLRGRFVMDAGSYNIALQIKGKDSGNETIYNFKEEEVCTMQ